MNKIVLCSDHYYNCPICGMQCGIEKKNQYNHVLRMQGSFQQFLCMNPLAQDPLHYYSHMVDPAEPNIVIYQEFSLDLGSKSVLFANNYNTQLSIIKSSYDTKPLELSFIIAPDFPHLTSLRKKVRTAITFS
jgi:hypothetical protein